jgi:hypothetical protein
MPVEAFATVTSSVVSNLQRHVKLSDGLCQVECSIYVADANQFDPCI